MTKQDVYCYALGMILNAAEDSVKELQGAGVNHPALERLETTRRVVELLSNPRLDIAADTPQVFTAFVNGLFDAVRLEAANA